MENVLDRISKSVGTQLQHPGKVLALTTDAGFSPVEVHARLVPVLPARSGLDDQVMQLLWDTVGDLQAAQRYCNFKKTWSKHGRRENNCERVPPESSS